MAIYKGNKKVVAVYKGSTPINKIYKGVTLVFQKSGGGNTHLFEGTATGNFDLSINGNVNGYIIPITPDADGKWFYDTDEKITNLDSAFYLVNEVTSVDLSNLDLTGIETTAMFRGSSEITSIKFNNTKIMKLTTIASMFNGCSSLTSLNLSSFDISDVTSPVSIFSGCSSLVSLDLSNFDMSKATSYNNIFKNCTSLSTIKCKQAFKDWCITNQDTIKLPDALREGGTGTWEIIV